MNSEDLFKKIMGRIEEEQRISRARRRLAIFSVISVVSLMFFVPVFKFVLSDIYGSGFLQYISLFFSDFEIVSVYWQNFTLLLLESVPAMSLALLFIVVFSFLESIRFVAKNIKLIFNSKQYGY